MNFESIFGIGFSYFILGFSRASGLIVTAPVFQSRGIPRPARIILAFVLALVVVPFIKTDYDLTKFSFWMAAFTLLQEVLVGLILGFMVNLTFYAIQLAGYFFDVTMGFGIVNIIDPNTGTEMPLLGQLNHILALLIFLAINGHHTLIKSFIQSYELIKPGMFFLSNQAVGIFVKAFSNMFFLGFKIGIPIIGTIFLVDVALGIIAKLVPQVNVFIIGFPVKIIMGMIMMILFLPVYILLIESSFANSGDTFQVLRSILRQLHF